MQVREDNNNQSVDELVKMCIPDEHESEWGWVELSDGNRVNWWMKESIIRSDCRVIRAVTTLEYLSEEGQRRYQNFKRGAVALLL